MHEAQACRLAEPARAVALLRQALTLLPGDPAIQEVLAQTLFVLGEDAAAIDIALPLTQHNRGRRNPFITASAALTRLGRVQEAAACMRRALQTLPDDTVIVTRAIQAFRAAGAGPEARAAAQLLVVAAEASDTPAIVLTAAGTMAALGDHAFAVRLYRRVVAMQPGVAAHWIALARCLNRLGQHQAAADAAAEALAAEPGNDAARYAYAIRLMRLGRCEDSLAVLDPAGPIEGRGPDVLLLLLEGAVLRGDAALIDRNCAALRDAAARAGRSEWVFFSLLGVGLTDLARRVVEGEARSQLSKGGTLALALLPPDLFATAAEIESWIAGLDIAMRGVPLDVVQAEEVPAPESLLTWHLLFADGVSAQMARSYAALMSRVHPWLAQLPRKLPPVSAGRGRLRIGLLVGMDQALARDALFRLDRHRFAPVLFSVGAMDDADIAAAAATGAEAIALPRLPSAAAEALIAARLDVLLFAHARTYFLAHARCAPVQCLWYEPPLADGAAAADYYLSWADGEPADWRHRYVMAPAFTDRLPYLLDRAFFPADALTRADFPELPANARWYVCPATAHKISIEFDPLALGVLERDPAGVLVLLRAEGLRMQLNRARMLRVRPDFADRILLLPTLPSARCHGLLRLADAVLDSVPLGGMSSALTAACLDLPKVTIERDIPFGRWASALYRRIGVSELIARDGPDFVEIAVRIAQDPGLRAALTERIRRGIAPMLRDGAAIREIEDFLVAAVARARQGLPPLPWIKGDFITDIAAGMAADPRNTLHPELS